MANKIEAPKRVVEYLTKHKLTTKECLWNPIKNKPNLWAIKHKICEQIAADKKITFDLPVIVESDSANKIVAVIVTGHMGDKTEWSFGEASPDNCKNSYPYAMAEKRGKDRVILKLIGLHGDVHSDGEFDPAEMQEQPEQTPEPTPEPEAVKSKDVQELETLVGSCNWTVEDFQQVSLKGKTFSEIEKTEPDRIPLLKQFLEGQAENTAQLTGAAQ